MALEQRDLELIERIIYKSADDVAVSTSRSFERLEERIDAMESRLYSRLSDVEDNIDARHSDIVENILNVQADVRELARKETESAKAVAR